jgi:hypothetical protein
MWIRCLHQDPRVALQSYPQFADPKTAHPVQDGDHLGRQEKPFPAGQFSDPAAVVGELVDLALQFGVDVGDGRGELGRLCMQQRVDPGQRNTGIGEGPDPDEIHRRDVGNVRPGLQFDRIGARKAAAIGAITGAIVVAGIGVVPSLVAVAVFWAVGGVAAQLLIVSLNALVLSGDGENRAGAVSVVQAGRFFGGALSPPVFTPVYQLLPAAGFPAPAILLAVVAPLGLWRSSRD